jgi:hypothetical protein
MGYRLRKRRKERAFVPATMQSHHKKHTHSHNEATRLKIVLVSPRDVHPERVNVAHVINELNEVTAKELGLVLDLWTWENDSYPGLHLLGPQGEIDEEMALQDADILIGIFWKRFGTPVTDARSGTEHEVRRAIAYWKQHHKPYIMMYFKAKSPPNLSDIDPDQLKLVFNFKKEIESLGLIALFNNSFHFADLLRKHLTLYLFDHYQQE